MRLRVMPLVRPARLPARLAMLGALICLFAAPAPAHSGNSLFPDKIPQPARSANAPDVQVLVLSNLSGLDQVDITYPVVVPRAQVKRDLDALSAASSWPMGGIQVSNSALPLSGVKTTPMTSVTFAAQGLVRKGQKWFQLEPFVVALRPYKRLTLTYMMPKQFAFAGLHDYADSHVHITLDRRGSVYTYLVSIADPNFQRLNLPLLQAPTNLQAASPLQQAQVVRPAQRLRTLKVAGVIVVGALALLVGLGVYVVLSRAT